MEDIKKERKNCKFISIVDPETKKKLSEILCPPEGATNFNFWESTKKVSPAEWGITLKQMPKNQSEKKHPGRLVWRCEWQYNPDFKRFDTVKDCHTLVKPIDGEQAEKLVQIYESYKK